MTEVLRQGARKLLAQAVEDEVTGFLADHTAVRNVQGRQMIVRNGHVPERQIQTGIGAVTVQAPRAPFTIPIHGVSSHIPTFSA